MGACGAIGGVLMPVRTCNLGTGVCDPKTVAEERRCVNIPSQDCRLVAGGTAFCSGCSGSANWVGACTSSGDDFINLTWAVVGVDTNLDNAVDSYVVLEGPTTVHRAGAVGATIATEIIAMNLTGGGMTLKAGTQTFQINPAVPPTIGQVAELAGDDTTADSFFDVFFEIDLGGGQKVYNQAALRLATTIKCAPPGAEYRRVSTQPVSLFTLPAGGSLAAKVITVRHVTVEKALDKDVDLIIDELDNCPVNANDLQANADGDAYGDACDPCPTDPTNSCTGAIPTVSEWGVAVMTLLVLTAATVVLFRRRSSQAA
jgi:hypothetical protein